jgi:putative ABC transport system permease protein
MLDHFFKITLRNLWRNKTFSAINIIGLSIGMASALLIGLWIQNEVSVDRFHEKADRIHLLYSREDNNGKPDVWPRVSALMAPELKKDYPEVEDAVKFRIVFFLMTEGDKHLNLRGAFADSTFLSVFSFPLLEGNSKNALSGDQGIVLTQNLAKSLFGAEDPMGKTVRIDSSAIFTVTGVLKDLPDNTEFTFQYLLPSAYLDRLGWDKPDWNFTNAVTYVLLKPGASVAAFDAKIQHINARHLRAGDAATRETFSQPLSRVHLYSNAENGQLVGGRIATVRLFTIIAVFILLIACINFMNLSTARSEKRAKEVGIRKVVGALRRSLVAQFIGESILLTLLAFGLALGIVQLSLKCFDQIIGVPLRLDLAKPDFWLFAIAFIVFTGLIAGSYPAFFLSSFKPVKVLKGTFKKVNALIAPRKILVVLQFTFAIILITCTIIVEQQIRYARNRKVGYNKDRLIYTFCQGDVLQHYDLIKHDLVSSGAALSVTKTLSPMTRAFGGTANGFTWPQSTPADKKFNFLLFQSDADLVKTTGTQLLQGRDIDMKTYPTDSTAMMLNEAAVKAMHLNDPVGKVVKDNAGISYHIVGIIRDFIIESPYEEVQPMIIQGLNDTYPVIHIRLNPANTIAADLKKAEAVFKTYNPQYPFDYYFIDEDYNRKFRTEQQEATLGILFAGLTVFISCLGLFGLATYMAETRTREIGIRKVLGASVAGVAALIARDFVKLVLVSVLIATPAAWFIMNKWLEGFNYRIQISGWIFLGSGVLAVIIAMATVSFQAIKAAVANPVRSLKIE